MNYLENTICQFTPLFDIDYTKRQNILSVSLFKLVKGYKKFDIYLNGLNLLNRYVDDELPEYRIRLFVDATIYQDNYIMNRLKRLDKADLVLYHCSDFIVKNNYHDGLFGTLVRFFPMFDFPNNDANIIWIMDADFDKRKYVHSFFQSFQKYQQHSGKLLDSYLFFHGRLFHVAAKDTGLNYIKAYAVAPKVFNMKRMDKRILIGYLYEVKYNKKNIIYSDYKKQRQLQGKTNFIFGVDEYFINHTVIKYLEENKLCFAYRYYYQIISLLFFANENLLDQKEKLSKMSDSDPNKKKLEKEVKLGEKYFSNIVNFVVKGIDETKNMSLKEKFGYIDKKVHIESYEPIPSHLDPLFYQLNYRMYIAFAILYKHKKFNFISHRMLRLAFKQNFQYIIVEKIDAINCGNNETDIVYKSIRMPTIYLINIAKYLLN